MLHYFDKTTGRKSRKPPQFAKRGQRIVALIETTALVCVERFSDYPQLGRFTLRDEGTTFLLFFCAISLKPLLFHRKDSGDWKGKHTRIYQDRSNCLFRLRGLSRPTTTLSEATANLAIRNHAA
jgi:hypothetical protein